MADFNLAVAQEVRQTAKFNSLPNLPAIWYAKTIAKISSTCSPMFYMEINDTKLNLFLVILIERAWMFQHGLGLRQEVGSITAVTYRTRSVLLLLLKFQF